MIGLKEYIVNEVSSDLLMKAAKKAKEIGDKRANKFFNAALKKAQQEFTSIPVDAQKEAKSKSKKVFNKLKSFGTPMFGFGSGSQNMMKIEVKDREGFFIVYTDKDGLIPTKKVIGDKIEEIANSNGLDHISEKIKKGIGMIEDDEQLMFFSIGLAPDKETKGAEVYRNCNFAQGVIFISPKGIRFNYDRFLFGVYTEYRPGEINTPKLNIQDTDDDDIDKMVSNIARTLSDQ